MDNSPRAAPTPTQTEPRPESIPALEARLAALEQSLHVLNDEALAIRAELRAAKAARGGEDPAPERPEPPTKARARPRLGPATFAAADPERLLGRYGMLIVAVVAAVAAVATFLSWAIANGYFTLGPAVRVSAGLAVAAAIGTWGARLRRTERSFGSSLLGLALVILHVCAYAAGPSLLLVPAWVAFAVAAFASCALALFAHAEDDEPLWCVGFGGAIVAPFAISNGQGNVVLLATYAACLLFWSCFAMSHRAWRVSLIIFYIGAAAFVFGIRGAGHGSMLASMLAVALPLAIAAAGVVPFSPESSKRGTLRWLAFLGALTALTTTGFFGVRGAVLGVVSIAAAALWLVILDRHADVPQSSITGVRRAPLWDWVDAAVLPLLFIMSAARWPAHTWSVTSLYIVAACGCAAFAWRRPVNASRDAAAFAASLCLLIAVWTTRPGHGIASVGAHLAVAVALLALYLARPSRSWLAMATVGLLAACGLAMVALDARPAYQYTPFATEASLSALLVAITLIALARNWRVLRAATRRSLGDWPAWKAAASLRQLVRAIVAAPWIWAFVWGLLELSRAFSPTTATLLLVVYFASTAVGCVGIGRLRNKARLRHLGLALALTAAAVAFYGAKTYFDVGARIAAYLVTSAFLLGIAYWYRRPGAAPFVTAGSAY